MVEHKNCVRLMTGIESPGRAWGETERADLMIDTSNGSLFLRCFTIDLSMHGSCIDIDIQWSSLDSLISRIGGTKLRSLSQDNWEEWLIENKYV